MGISSRLITLLLTNKYYRFVKNIKKYTFIIGTGVENLLEYPEFKNNNNIILTNLKMQSNTLLAEFAMLGCLYFSKEV